MWKVCVRRDGLGACVGCGTVLGGVALMGDGFCVDEVRRRDGLCVDEVRRLGTALVTMRCVGGKASCR